MGYADVPDQAGKVKIILELIDLNSWSRHSSNRDSKKQKDLRLNQPEDIRLSAIKNAIFRDSLSDLY